MKKSSFSKKLAYGNLAFVQKNIENESWTWTKNPNLTLFERTFKGSLFPGQAEEALFRAAPRDFSMFGYSPIEKAYRALLTLEAADVFYRPMNGVHKDMSARGLLQLAQETLSC